MNLKVTIILLAVFASSLQADILRYILTSASPVNSSGISGFSSDKKTIRQPGNNAILYGLEFDEKGDKPCYINAHWWRFSSQNLPQELTTKFDICNSTPKVDKSLIFNSTASSRLAINSIQVCSNKKNNHRLKGVKVTAANIDNNNSAMVENTNLKLSFERPNCSVWKKNKSCLNGEIAVGLIIHHSPDEITGIELMCSRPIIKPTSVDVDSLSDSAIVKRFEALETDIQVQVSKGGNTEKMTINEAIAKHEVNGVTVAVIEDAKVSVVRHYGLRSKKNNLPTNKDTIYQAASTSKFVAAIGMLIATHKDHGPKLNRRVSKTAKKNPDSLLEKWLDKQFKGDEANYPVDITVKRLLSHTAGLDTHGVGTARNDSRNIDRILLGAIGDPGVKPQAKPGVEYDYSGGGFTVAEAMLEAHSGSTSTSFLNSEVLKPLGMIKSTFKTADDSMGNLARGCSRGICSNTPERTLVKFAGGLLANPREYANLLTIILNRGKDSNNVRVIERSDIDLLTTPASHINSSLQSCTSHSSCSNDEKCFNSQCRLPLNADGYWYGLGIKLSDTSEFNGYPRTLSHGGTQDGVRTYFYIDRKDKNGIVIMVNGKYNWKKKSVEYGAKGLEKDIRESFFRHYP